MNKLYYSQFDPFSRKIFLLLKECQMNFELLSFAPFSATDEDFPLFIFNMEYEGSIELKGYSAIMYVIEKVKSDSFIFNKHNIAQSLQAYKLSLMFDEGFYHDVYMNLFVEKVLPVVDKSYIGNTKKIGEGYQQLNKYLNYCENLLKNNDKLIDDNISIADISVASHLSCIDYIGDINWQRYDRLKDWYQIIKSRPSFKEILKERIIGRYPSKTYIELDF